MDLSHHRSPEPRTTRHQGLPGIPAQKAILGAPRGPRTSGTSWSSRANRGPTAFKATMAQRAPGYQPVVVVTRRTATVVNVKSVDSSNLYGGKAYIATKFVHINFIVQKS